MAKQGSRFKSTNQSYSQRNQSSLNRSNSSPIYAKGRYVTNKTSNDNLLNADGLRFTAAVKEAVEMGKNTNVPDFLNKINGRFANNPRPHVVSSVEVEGIMDFFKKGHEHLTILKQKESDTPEKLTRCTTSEPYMFTPSP